ncbi:hypothetical protein TNCT_15701 [Trichonephila clavata]|uniref:Uncharacterized protein n=1 Tax=Trichonephila clavata TaxID=2740835 RepID=A0A8X6H0Q1_TRICU|nr:hypothetical protein TNCT_15701 [Trichonephila clavata]
MRHLKSPQTLRERQHAYQHYELFIYLNSKDSVYYSSNNEAEGQTGISQRESLVFNHCDKTDRTCLKRRNVILFPSLLQLKNKEEEEKNS